MTATRRAAMLLAPLVAVAGLAHDVAPLAGDLEIKDGRLVAGFDLGPAFPPDLRKQLGNGLTNVVVLHVTLAPVPGEEPAAVYVRETEVLYDVWEETYRVTLRDPEHPRGHHLTFAAWEALRAFLAEVRQIDVAPASILGDRTWVVSARVEVNPVSQELLDRTRELIANPAAGARVGGASRSVLGAMASYLLGKGATGADVHVFRSRPFSARGGAIR